MSLTIRRNASTFCLLAVAFLAGCGGATLAEEQTPHGDAGKSGDAATKDATRTRDVTPGVDVSRGVDVVEKPDAACTANPTEGAACDPGVSTACPQPGNPCCIGYVWECNSATGTWVKEGLGCACMIDASVVLDSGGTMSDASDECGGCPVGDVCVVTTSSGGACIQPGDGGVCPNGTTAPPGSCCDDTSVATACKHRPAACGANLSCTCAASLCACQCMSTLGSTVECVCAFP